MNEATRRRQVATAVTALVVCCVLWGLSFPVMQFATRALESEAGTVHGGLNEKQVLALRATFNGWRFGIAAIIYLSVAGWKLGRISRVDVVGGTIVGVFFSAGMLFQVVGLRYALPSVSSFLTALAVVFAPLGQVLLLRKRVGAATWVAVGLALGGIVILSRSNDGAAAANTLTHAPPMAHLGEILTVFGAALFTGQILALGHYGTRADSVRLTVVMLAVTGAANLVLGLALGGADFYSPRLGATLARNTTFVASTASLILLSSLLALHLMNRYQPIVSAAAASVIYCLEPVFCTAWSVLFRTERLTQVTMIGGLLVLGAVLVVVRATAARAERT